MNAWSGIDDATIVAVCDNDADRLTSMGHDFDVSRRYGDAEALFADGGFEFVDIATTIPSHRRLLQLAADYGIPAICQKPFATTIGEAEQMVQLFQKGRHLAHDPRKFPLAIADP
jgi:predicted dehydrogenase